MKKCIVALTVTTFFVVFIMFVLYPISPGYLDAEVNDVLKIYNVNIEEINKMKDCLMNIDGDIFLSESLGYFEDYDNALFYNGLGIRGELTEDEIAGVYGSFFELNRIYKIDFISKSREGYFMIPVKRHWGYLVGWMFDPYEKCKDRYISKIMDLGDGWYIYKNI